MQCAFGMPQEGVYPSAGGPPPENFEMYMLSDAIWHILGLIFSALIFAILCFRRWYHVKVSAGKTFIKDLIQGMAEPGALTLLLGQSGIKTFQGLSCIDGSEPRLFVLLVYLYFSSENNVKLFQFGCCHASSLCCN